MARPNAWSHTALDTFENCPRQYHETKVLKRWPFEPTKEMLWGREVHKAFEDYLVQGTPLRADLQQHEEFLARYKGLPGDLAGEERIALSIEPGAGGLSRLKPCAYFSKTEQVWYRGQVDARKRTATTAYILDHKTGKVKNDYTQLKGFAMWEFIVRPEIQEVRAEYYWTQTKTASGEVYTRDQLPELAEHFRPKLARFGDAFLTDTWVPKQSGLCHGWCPVTDCEYWQPKRKKS